MLLRVAKEATILLILVAIVAVTALATLIPTLSQPTSTVGGKAIQPNSPGALDRTPLSRANPQPTATNSNTCQATDPECAQDPVDGCDVRNQDFYPVQDYTFPNGIQICADNRVVDCGGHTIQGTNVAGAVGIRTSSSSPDNSNVIIRNCVVSNYNVGIYVYGTNPAFPVIAENNELRSNNDGMIVGGSGSVARKNKVLDSVYAGINLDGFESKIIENSISNSIFQDTTRGIYMSLDRDTRHLLQGNKIQNFGNGILVGNNQNQLIGNQLENNKVGINFMGTPSGGATGNEVRDNVITYNLRYGVNIPTMKNNAETLYNNVICFNQGDIVNGLTSQASGDENTCNLVSSWNDAGTIGCTYPCQPPICGNGIIEHGESCDTDPQTGDCIGCGSNCVCGSNCEMSCSGTGARRCTPGQTQDCFVGNCPGTRTCSSTRQWTPCQKKDPQCT